MTGSTSMGHLVWGPGLRQARLIQCRDICVSPFDTVVCAQTRFPDPVWCATSGGVHGVLIGVSKASDCSSRLSPVTVTSTICES